MVLHMCHNAHTTSISEPCGFTKINGHASQDKHCLHMHFLTDPISNTIYIRNQGAFLLLTFSLEFIAMPSAKAWPTGFVVHRETTSSMHLKPLSVVRLYASHTRHTYDIILTTRWLTIYKLVDGWRWAQLIWVNIVQFGTSGRCIGNTWDTMNLQAKYY